MKRVCSIMSNKNKKVRYGTACQDVQNGNEAGTKYFIRIFLFRSHFISHLKYSTL